MNYEIYKTARNTSWKFLIQQNVTSLPVNLKKIVSEMGIIIKKDSGLLDSNENGRIINNNGQLVIIVRDISTAQNRYTIMHEIGHIVFGHADGITNDVDEYTVERFAIDVLATACVLWGLDLHSAEDIANVCNISITSAQRRAERMRILYDRNMFLSHPLERQVFEQFRDFINNQNKIK